MPTDERTSSMFFFTLLGEEGILGRLPQGALTYGFVTREQREADETQIFRYFSCPEEFIRFCDQYYPLNSRFFNEFIPGNQDQKPHFDIDIEVGSVDPKQPTDNVTKENIDIVAKAVLASFRKALKETISDKLRRSYDEVRDVVIYESNFDLEGNSFTSKRSYHVIVLGWKWNNSNEGRYFTKYLRSRMTYGKRFVDLGVTSNNSFLRMVGSRKVKGLGIFSGLKRRIIDDKDHNYITFPLNDYKYAEEALAGLPYGRVPPNHKDYALFELRESLVTYIRDEESLPSIAPPPKKTISMSISETDLGQVISFLEAHYPGQYSIGKINNNAINLKSNFPAVCEMCERVHENMQPTIFICRNGEARFYCGRRPTEKVFISLGYIDMGVLDDDDDERVKATKRLALCGKQQVIVNPGPFHMTEIFDPIRTRVMITYPGDTSFSRIPWGKEMLPLVRDYHTLVGSETMLTSHIVSLKPFYTEFGYQILPFNMWKKRWDPVEVEQNIEIPNCLFGNHVDVYTDKREVHRLMCRDLMRSLRIISEDSYHYNCLEVTNNGSLSETRILKSYFTQPRFLFTHESERVDITSEKKDAKGKLIKEKIASQPVYKMAIFWNDMNAELLYITRKVGVSVCNQIFNARVGDYKITYPTASDYDLDIAIRYGNGDLAECANNYMRNGFRNNSIPQLQTCVVDIFTVDRSQITVNVPERSPQYIQQFTAPAIAHNPGFVPDPSIIERYQKYIKDVCGGTDQAYLNVMNIIKFALITGERPSKCIFICGASGSGKSAFCQMIRSIYGPMAAKSIDFDSLLSNFNSWAEARLIVMEESGLGTRKAISSGMLNKLKNLITNETTSIERKGRDIVEVENSSFFMICSDRPEKILDKGMIRRFISVCPKNDPVFNRQEELDCLMGHETLRNLVAYFTASYEDIAQWNRTLAFNEQIMPLNTIEEIRAMRDNMTDPKSEFGRGGTVEERCWQAIEDGCLKFPYELCFKKSSSGKWKAGAGNIYIHPIGFHKMFHRLMVTGKCSSEQQYDMFATEAEKKRSDSDSKVTSEMYSHSARHKGKIQMRQLMDNWISIEILNSRGYIETVTPGFKDFNLEKFSPQTLRSYGKFDDTLQLINKNERWYRLNKDWVDAYEQICTKPEDQIYPKFCYADIEIDINSSRAHVDGSLHECIRVIEPKAGVQESNADETDDILWSTPASRFEQQATDQAQVTQWWSQSKFAPYSIVASPVNEFNY